MHYVYNGNENGTIMRDISCLAINVGQVIFVFKTPGMVLVILLGTIIKLNDRNYSCRSVPSTLVLLCTWTAVVAFVVIA